MMSSLISALVATVFVIAIASVWLSKPINKGPLFHDTGYDEGHPPTPREWRSVRIGYTVLLVFLGSLFIFLTWRCMQ